MENYYKCVSDDYSQFENGKNYTQKSIGLYLERYPKDFKKIKAYPSVEELIDCIENGTNKTKIIKTLKQWKTKN